MKRIFALSFLAITLPSLAAKPLETYEGILVPVPQRYAPQGIVWGLTVGVNRINDNSLAPEYSVKPMMGPAHTVGLPDMTIISKNQGLLLAGEVNYRMKSWRWGLEFSYRSNSAEEVENLPTAAFDSYYSTLVPAQTTPTTLSASGHTVVLAAMATLHYDYYFQNGFMMMAGLGGGYAMTRYSIRVNVPDPMKLDISENVSGFALQADVGVGYAWTNHLETALSLRYFYPSKESLEIQNGIVGYNNTTKQLQIFPAQNSPVSYFPQIRAISLNLEFKFS